MPADPVVLTWKQLNRADYACDRAAVRGDTAACDRLHGYRFELSELICDLVPTTAAGAAILIRDAAGTVDAGGDSVAPWFGREARRIAWRLSRGQRRLGDLIALRALVALAHSQYDRHVAAPLANALAGLTRPGVVTAVPGP